MWTGTGLILLMDSAFAGGQSMKESMIKESVNTVSSMDVLLAKQEITINAFYVKIL